MRRTLRETLAYLFEATAPKGAYKINDKIKLSVVPGEKKVVSFSLRRDDLFRDEPNSEEMKKVASLVSGYILKYKMKHASVSLGVSAEGQKMMQAIEKYFNNKKSEEYKASYNATNGILDIERLKVEKEPKEKKAPTGRKRTPKEFVDGELNVGVKRIFKIEKDEEGNVIKKYEKIFPKYATVKKLVMALKRKGGGTVEVYNYSTRRDAGLLKKKVTWREKQHQNELKDMEGIRTLPEKEAVKRNEDYLNLKRELRKKALREVKLATKNPNVKLDGNVEKLVRSVVNSSLGRFGVDTDWGSYEEADKDIIINKVIKEVKYKFSNLFRDPYIGTKPKAKEKVDLTDLKPKYRRIVKTLMDGDKITKAEALDRVKEAEREVKKYLDRNLINVAEREFEKLIGLEPEFLYDLF